MIKRALITVLLLLIGVELLSIAIGIRVEWREFAVGLLLGAAGLALVTVLPQLTAWIGIQALRRDGFLHPQTYTVTKEHFEACSYRGSTSIKWPAVQRIERSDERLYIFISNRIAYIVPRRVFAEACAFDAFCLATRECFDERL